MRKLILALLILLVTINAKDFKNLSFSDYIQFISNSTGQNIVIADNINKNFEVFLPNYDFKDTKSALAILDNILSLNELDKKQINDVILIYRPAVVPDPVLEITEEIKNVYYIPLDNLVFEDIESLVSLYDIQTKYISTTNAVVYKATKEQNERIHESLKQIDYKLQQIQFKITVLETNLNDIKERGIELSAYLQSDNTVSEDSPGLPFNYFLNLITMPYTATTNVLSNSKGGFYSVLKYLDNNGFTKIKNSPTLTAKSNKKVSFSSVRNIPYLVTQKQIVDSQSSETSSYDYRDVGLKIQIEPVVLKDYVSFTLDLSLEDVVTANSFTPETTKRNLSGNYSLKKGELLILSGINRETSFSTEYGIPVLKDIYILGELFKYKSNSTENSVLTITIELL